MPPRWNSVTSSPFRELQCIKNNDGATVPRERFDDTFSRLDTIHERDSRTDGWTLDDSKDRADA